MLRIHTRAYTLTCTHTVGVVDEGSPPQTASPSHNPRLPLEVSDSTWSAPVSIHGSPRRWGEDCELGNFSRLAAFAVCYFQPAWMWLLTRQSIFPPLYHSRSPRNTARLPACMFPQHFCEQGPLRQQISSNLRTSRVPPYNPPIVWGTGFFFCSCDTRGLWPHHR